MPHWPTLAVTSPSPTLPSCFCEIAQLYLLLCIFLAYINLFVSLITAAKKIIVEAIFVKFLWFFKVQFGTLRAPWPSNSEEWGKVACGVIEELTKDVFHIPKDSGNSGWFVPLESYRIKRNFWKGSPVFPEETSKWKFMSIYRFLGISQSSLSPVPCLSRSFLKRDLQRWRLHRKRKVATDPHWLLDLLIRNYL